MASVPDQRASLPERLTLEQAVPALAQMRSALLAQPGSVAVLDASALRECDCSAVAVLLELRRALQQQGKTLQLQNGPQRLRDLVALYGVQELLAV